MEQEDSSFEQAIIYFFFLMLSADKIADLKELELGNKIFKSEHIDISEAMREIDTLSGMPRDKVYEVGLVYLKSLNKEDQLKCLGYIKLISSVDGNIDTNESELLNNLCLNELNFTLLEVGEIEKKLTKKLSKYSS